MSAQAVRNLLRVDSLSESTFGDEGIRQTKESVGPRYRGGPRSLPGNARSGATGQSGTPMIPAPIPMGADGTLVRNLGCFRLPTERSVLTPQAASPSIAIMISKTLDPRRIDGLKVEKVKLDRSVECFDGSTRDSHACHPPGFPIQPKLTVQVPEKRAPVASAESYVENCSPLKFTRPQAGIPQQRWN